MYQFESQNLYTRRILPCRIPYLLWRVPVGLSPAMWFSSFLKWATRYTPPFAAPKKKKKIQHLLDMQERWPSKLTLFKANFLVTGSFEAPMKGCLFSCLSCCIALFHQKHHPRWPKGGSWTTSERDPLCAGCSPEMKNSQNCRVDIIHGSCFWQQCQCDGNKAKDTICWVFQHKMLSEIQCLSYSKTVAEKEAWKLVTINPGLILSPSLSPTSKSRSLSLLDQLLGGQLFLGVPDMWFAIFDLWDVATAHIQAAETPGSSGCYILADKRSHNFVELACILRSITH